MDHVKVPIEENDADWRQRCYEKVGRLKAVQFPIPDPPPSQQLKLLQEETFGKKNSIIFELQNVVRNGNVDDFVDALEKVCLKNKLVLSAIFDQVTPSRDSLLHEAAYFGKEKIAELIGYFFPELVTRTNIDGDTPLHIAARSKHSSVIRVILSQSHAHAQGSSNSLVVEEKFITRLTNECGNTALHEAVSSKHVEGIILLFEADKRVTHCLNKSDKSALYLAVQTLDKKTVNVLLDAPFPDDKPIPKCHGISPLHAAVKAKNEDLMNEIVEKRSDLVNLRDEDGGTPLHYAAAVGYAEGVRVLLNKSSQAALECNTKGHLPIHLAAKWGHIEVLKELFGQEWDVSRLFLNKKGQNILHVAAKSGQHRVVKYILKDKRFNQLAVNKKDINGNTPLHLAARRNLNSLFALSIRKLKGTDLNIINNEGLTARDILLLKMPMTVEQATSNLVLKLAGAKRSDKGRTLLPENKSDKLRDLDDRMKHKMNTLMLVATFIVTVTFAAGFTMPGGYNSSDHQNPGRAVLGDSPIFKTFIVLDTLAMYCSTLGSFLILGAMIGKFKHLRAYAIALFLVGLSLLLMTLAFLAAMALVVSNISSLVSFLVYLGTYSFYIIWILWKVCTA